MLAARNNLSTTENSISDVSTSNKQVYKVPTLAEVQSYFKNPLSDSYLGKCFVDKFGLWRLITAGCVSSKKF